jgi:hypothetical protein
VANPHHVFFESCEVAFGAIQHWKTRVFSLIAFSGKIGRKKLEQVSKAFVMKVAFWMLEASRLFVEVWRVGVCHCSRATKESN